MAKWVARLAQPYVIRALVALTAVLVTGGGLPGALLALAASVHPLTTILLLAILVVPSSPLLGAVTVSLIYGSEHLRGGARPLLLAMLAGFSGVLAGYYALLVYRVVVSPPGAPILLREVLAKLYSSYTLRFLAAIAALAPILYVYNRVARVASDALASPAAARLLLREWLRREAEKVRRLRTWYHNLLFYALGALMAMPLSILTSALIAVIYTGLELIAPPNQKWVIEALGVARGVITLFLFAVLDYLMAAWFRGFMEPGWRRAKPSKLPIAGTLTLLALSIVLALLLAPASVTALNPFSPPPPPSVFDQEAGRVLGMLAMRIEMSEKALRALVEFLWGG